MATRRAIQERLNTALGRYQPRTKWFHAWTGDDNGLIPVPGKIGFIYVTDWNGVVHQAFNEVAPIDQAGYAVRVGKDSDDPSRLRVLGMANVYTQVAYPKLVSHHATHEWPGTDTVWVQGPQFTPALVIAKSGMTVSVFPFMLRMLDGTAKYLAYQELDLTPYVPTAGARWVCIGFSQTTGLISVVAGNVISGSLYDLLATNVPASQTGTVQLAAVTCYTGQTAIRQDSTRNEIVDLRWIGTGGSVSVGLQYYADNPTAPGPVALSGESVLPSRGDHGHPLQVVADLLQSFALAGKYDYLIVADLDDWDPPENPVLANIRVTLDANHSIGGISGGRKGRVLLITNADSSHSLTLKDNAAGSLAANRFLMNGHDLVLETDGVALSVYDDTSAVWRVVSGGGGGGGSGDMLKAVFDLNNNGVVDNSESAQALQGNPIDPALVPALDHSLFWDGAKYIDGAGPALVAEDLSAQVDGVTATFSTLNPFISGSLQVFENGLCQNSVDITEDPARIRFTLSYVPAAGHQLFVRYATTGGPLGQVQQINPWATLSEWALLSGVT